MLAFLDPPVRNGAGQVARESQGDIRVSMVLVNDRTQNSTGKSVTAVLEGVMVVVFGDDRMNLMYAYLIGCMYSRFSFASVQNMTMTQMYRKNIAILGSGRHPAALNTTQI